MSLAGEWAGHDDPPTRALALLVLGQVAMDDPEVLEQLFDVAAADDESALVRAATAEALGLQSGNSRCGEVLLQMVDDVDETVRIKAIGGLGTTLPDDVSPNNRAVSVLTGLLDDPAAAVRDWAAFVLGTQLEVDSAELRDRFLVMAQTDLDTDEIYPAAEAAVALARRRDERVLPVIARRLTEDQVGRLWLDASAALAHPDLLAPLEALRELERDDGDSWDHALAAALEACRSGKPPDL